MGSAPASFIVSTVFPELSTRKKLSNGSESSQRTLIEIFPANFIVWNTRISLNASKLPVRQSLLRVALWQTMLTTTDPLRKFGTVLLVKRFHIPCSLLGSYDTTTRSTWLLRYFKCRQPWIYYIYVLRMPCNYCFWVWKVYSTVSP